VIPEALTTVERCVPVEELIRMFHIGMRANWSPTLGRKICPPAEGVICNISRQYVSIDLGDSRTWYGYPSLQTNIAITLPLNFSVAPTPRFLSIRGRVMAIERGFALVRIARMNFQEVPMAHTAAVPTLKKTRQAATSRRNRPQPAPIVLPVDPISPPPSSDQTGVSPEVTVSSAELNLAMVAATYSVGLTEAAEYGA